MIYDTLSNIENYKNMPQIYRALQLLRNTDFSGMAEGTYEIDGRDFRYQIDSYKVDKVNVRPEAHRNFIDIQYVISGAEMVGVAPLRTMTEVEGRPENDIWFYEGELHYLPLCEDRFMVFFPNDAHAPASRMPEGDTQVRKCLFKIRVTG